MQNVRHYDLMVRNLRSFFQQKGFLEVPASSRLSIMAACEDPTTVTMFEMGEQIWPCSQTGQMWLEMELLKNPSIPGVFCLGPSFRNEKNIITGRHDLIFPMFDFEGKGSFQDLQMLESELLITLGFEAPISKNYEDLCAEYGTTLLKAPQEGNMCKEINSTISLEKHPFRSDPFWNMRYVGDGIFNKIDVIMYGMETIGSAERSCSPDEMLHYFHTISEGGYAKMLFDLFGKERVMRELDAYLALNFFPRFGGGIGLTRLEHAYIQAGLFDEQEPYVPSYTFTSAQPTL
jgi:aspartyl/asparaginyl-tRNA synthetase